MECPAVFGSTDDDYDDYDYKRRKRSVDSVNLLCKLMTSDTNLKDNMDFFKNQDLESENWANLQPYQGLVKQEFIGQGCTRGENMDGDNFYEDLNCEL